MDEFENLPLGREVRKRGWVWSSEATNENDLGHHVWPPRASSPGRLASATSLGVMGAQGTMCSAIALTYKYSFVITMSYLHHLALVNYVCLFF